MNKIAHQRFPDGTAVRFTEEALQAMAAKRDGDMSYPRPIRTPVGGGDAVYTIDNTDDLNHDVILRENNERWGVYWLREATPELLSLPAEPVTPFAEGDRIRHPRRWYGAVVEDAGGDEVLVRFDDGTPHEWVPRGKLRLVDELDSEVAELAEGLGQLRTDASLNADEVLLLDRAIKMLGLALTDRGLRVRVAAEIDRLSKKVEHEPFDKTISKLPRVRQWFAAGAIWALRKLREHAQPDRVDTTPPELAEPETA